MNYVDSLEVELAAAGIPARRRARIVAEFTDHLHENPVAELGAPPARLRIRHELRSVHGTITAGDDQMPFGRSHGPSNC